MFGISWTEFLVIVLIAICVIPAKYWPDVAKWFGKFVKFIRNLIWKITDYSEQIQHRLDIEQPINDIIENAKQNMFDNVKPIRKKRTIKK